VCCWATALKEITDIVIERRRLFILYFFKVC